MTRIDYSKMESIDPELAAITREMFEQFMSLYIHWFEKYPVMTLYNCLQLPLNATMYLISSCNGNISQTMPSLPDVFIKMLKPFERLKGAWGKISDDDFVQYYHTFFKEQCEDIEINKEDGEIITKLFKGTYEE